MNTKNFIRSIKNEFVNIAKEFNCDFKANELQIKILSYETTNINSENNLNELEFFYSNPVILDRKIKVVQIKKFNYDSIIENSIVRSIIKMIEINSKFYDANELFVFNNSYKNNLVNNIIESYLNDILFNSVSLIHELSIKTYEKDNCYGSLCFLDKYKNNGYSIRISDNSPIEFNNKNRKMLTKLLVATNNRQETEDALVLNICKNPTNNILYAESYISLSNTELQDPLGNLLIKFYGKGNWELFCLKSHLEEKSALKKHMIIGYKNSKYYQNNALEYNTNQVEKKIRSFLSKFGQIENFDNFKRLIKSIKEDNHGAIIIVTNDDEYIEKTINYDRSTKAIAENIEPLFYKGNYKKSENDTDIEGIAPLCAIDGAVLFDKNGKLKAFGTILDGVICSKGERSRGSRYNSTKTFIESKIKDNQQSKKKSTIKKYLAVVISEDGPTNVFTTYDKICEG